MNVYMWVYVVGFVLMAPYTTWQYFNKLSGWGSPFRGLPRDEKLGVFVELAVFYLFWIPSLVLMIVTAGMAIQEWVQGKTQEQRQMRFRR